MARNYRFRSWVHSVREGKLAEMAMDAVCTKRKRTSRSTCSARLVLPLSNWSQEGALKKPDPS